MWLDSCWAMVNYIYAGLELDHKMPVPRINKLALLNISYVESHRPIG